MLKSAYFAIDQPSLQTYEEKRQIYKNSTFSAICILFKGTVGLGLLVNQYYLAKAGLILGPMLTILITFLITYSIHLVLKLANEIEIEKGNGFKFETMDQLVDMVLGPLAKNTTKIFTFLLNQAAVVINAINFSKFLRDKFVPLGATGVFADLDFFKLVTSFIFLCVMGMIIEPEKLKYPAYISAVVLLVGVLILWINNTEVIIDRGSIAPLNYFNVSGIGTLVGSQLYSFESIGIIFGIRATLKQPHHMKRVLVITFVGIVFLFGYNGMSFLMVS